MIFGFFWKRLPSIFPYSAFCLARQRIHIVRQLLEASGSCRQTCSQQSDVRSFQLNMVSVPVSMRTRRRRWSVGAKRGLNGRRPKKTSNEKRFSLTGHHIPAPAWEGCRVSSSWLCPVSRCLLVALAGRSWCLVASGVVPGFRVVSFPSWGGGGADPRTVQS